MDPHDALNTIAEAFGRLAAAAAQRPNDDTRREALAAHLDTLAEAAADLLHWLQRGGFPPSLLQRPLIVHAIHAERDARDEHEEDLRQHLHDEIAAQRERAAAAIARAEAAKAREAAPPPCGHSACRQHWIDTGSSECVTEAAD